MALSFLALLKLEKQAVGARARRLAKFEAASIFGPTSNKATFGRAKDIASQLSTGAPASKAIDLSALEQESQKNMLYIPAKRHAGAGGSLEKLFATINPFGLWQRQGGKQEAINSIKALAGDQLKAKQELAALRDNPPEPIGLMDTLLGRASKKRDARKAYDNSVYWAEQHLKQIQRDKAHSVDELKTYLKAIKSPVISRFIDTINRNYIQMNDNFTTGLLTPFKNLTKADKSDLVSRALSGRHANMRGDTIKDLNKVVGPGDPMYNPDMAYAGFISSKENVRPSRPMRQSDEELAQGKGPVFYSGFPQIASGYGSRVSNPGDRGYMVESPIAGLKQLGPHSPHFHEHLATDTRGMTPDQVASRSLYKESPGNYESVFTARSKDILKNPVNRLFKLLPGGSDFQRVK